MLKNSNSGPRNLRRGRPGVRSVLHRKRVKLLALVALMAVGAGAASVQQPSAPPETQTLHVLAGKSVVINLEVRLKRVLVSNPAVIEAITTTPRQLVVTAKGVGASSLILWDETGRSRLLDVLVDLDVSALRDSIQLAYPSEPIQVQAEGDRLILSGSVSSQEVIDGVGKMAETFSKSVVNSMTLSAPPHARSASRAGAPTGSSN